MPPHVNTIFAINTLHESVITLSRFKEHLIVTFTGLVIDVALSVTMIHIEELAGILLLLLLGEP
jgi:hypothetical protein